MIKKGFFLIYILSITNVFSQTKTYGLTQKFAGGDENGFVLFSPMNSDSTFLINKCGQRVHSWHNITPPGLSTYLKPNGNLVKTGVYADTTFGVAGGKAGVVEEYDWDNNLLWSHVFINDTLFAHHDIEVLPNGNLLILSWHEISNLKAKSLGRLPQNFNQNIKSNFLWGERITEIKPLGTDSLEIVWEWDLFDHIIQNVDPFKANFGDPSIHPELMDINYALELKTFDWIHANSISYNAELDQIVLSAHNISEFWIIDHSTSTAEAASHTGGNFGKGGDFLYRWGNPAAYKQGTASDQKLFRQHDAKWIPNGFLDSGKIMVFNNGWGRSSNYSSVDVIEVPDLKSLTFNNAPYGPANPSWSYQDSVPANFYSAIISGAQRLPNGNTLICEGTKGHFFEVTPSKKIVWDYKNPYIGNAFKKDGSSPQTNNVFRCSFYPSSFGAFIGKDMSGKGVLEKNPLPYSCIYGTQKPSLVSLFPAKGAENVNIKSPLKITFDRGMQKRISGAIEIYNGNQQIELIMINETNITITDNVVTIFPSATFPVNSIIKVRLRANSLEDSVKLIYSKVIDTFQWQFKTMEKYPTILTLTPNNNTLNVLPSQTLKLGFNVPVTKSNSGNVYIYENFILKETIAIANSRIDVDDISVYITPTQSFKNDAVIFIAIDSCFQDIYGNKSLPINYGNWVFLTPKSPKMAVLTPALNQIDVDVNSNLSILFDQNIKVIQNSNIEIYQNNVLHETIGLQNSNKIVKDSNLIVIKNIKPFSKNARITVKLPSVGISSLYDVACLGSDTAAWVFYTIKTGNTNNVNLLRTLKFSVYPNPTNGVLSFVYNEAIESLKIMDITGKLIEVNLISNNQIDVSALNSGIYTLIINNTATAKFLKE